jgi:hypothetical protein
MDVGTPLFYGNEEDISRHGFKSLPSKKPAVFEHRQAAEKALYSDLSGL